MFGTARVGAQPSEDEFMFTAHDETLRTAYIQRQNEMNQLTDYRIKSFENILKQKDSDYKVLHQKYAALQADFEHNYKLIEGRDEELRRYDAAFSKIKRELADRYVRTK